MPPAAAPATVPAGSAASAAPAPLAAGAAPGAAGRSPTVLVVDDERKIVEIVRAYLERDGFRVVTAADGQEALRRFRQDHPDLLVLDLMLPLVSGWDVCRAVRAESAAPVILLTARDDVTDKVLGLELGADDYVTKPFEPRELVARVRAHLRRAACAPESRQQSIRWGALELDPETREVRRLAAAVAPGLDGAGPGSAPVSIPLQLTRSEFELLAALAAHPGRVYTRLQLLEVTQGDAYPGYERTIDSHIKNLRQKVEPDPRHPRYVLTVFGVGYKAAQDPEPACPGERSVAIPGPAPAALRAP